MSPKLCIICCQPLPIAFLSSSLQTLPGSNGSKTLNDILTTYFIAKKLLTFSDSKCLQIVEARRKLNNSEVFRMCESCEEIVNKAVKYHQKILNLKEEIQVLGDSLKQIINAAGESNDVFLQGTEGEEDDGGALQGIRNLLSGNAVVKVEVEPCPEITPVADDDNDDFFAEDGVFPGGGNQDDNVTTTSTKGKSRVRKRKTSNGEDSDSDYDPAKDLPSTPSKKKTKRTVKAPIPKNKGDLIMAGNQRKFLSGKYGDIIIDRQKNHFPCQFCSSVYSTPSGFKKHLSTHEDSDRLGNIFDCPQCKHPNLTEEKLRWHVRKIHEQCKNTCDICGHVSDRRYLHDKHMLKMHNITNWVPIQAPGETKSVVNPDTSEILKRTFNCGLCESVFFKVREYKKHVRNHEESRKLGGKFDCSICLHPHLSLNFLRKHMTWIHGQVITEEDSVKHEMKEETNEDVKAEILVIGEEHNCKRCSSTFRTIPALRRHNRAHLASDLLGNKFDCKICKHPTTSEGNLRRHLNTIHGENNPPEIIENVNGSSVEEVDIVNEVHGTTEVIDSSKRPKRSTTATVAFDSNLLDDDQDEVDDCNENDDNDDDWDPVSSASDGEKRASGRTSPEISEEEDDDDDSDSDFEDKAKRKSGTSSQEYVCEKCNVVYMSQKGYRRHQEEHEASIRLNHKFDCDKCGYPASCEKKLHYHKRRIHQEVKKFSCSICGFEALRSTNLRNHMLKHSANYQKSKVGRKKKWIGTGKGEKQYECTLCESKYKSSTGLHRHLREHAKCKALGSKFDCEICKFPCRDNQGLRRHKVQAHEIVGVECKLCGRKFPRQNKLRAHLVVHKRYDRFMDSTGLYKCPVCPYTGSMQGFILHKNHKHTDLRLDDPDGTFARFLCNQCGLSFTTRPLLKNHTRNKHENKFRYNCEVCGKGFESVTAFKGHVKIHDKDRTRDFVCSCCGAMYSHKKTLDEHMTRFHPDQISEPSVAVRQGVKAEKPGNHKCKWCNEIFPFKYLLVNHLPIAHKDMYNFSCDICNKAYISASSLRLHKEITHSDGSLKFSCEYCGKAFVHKHYVICHYKFCSVKKQGISSTTTPSNQASNTSYDSTNSTFRQPQDLATPAMPFHSSSNNFPGPSSQAPVELFLPKYD